MEAQTYETNPNIVFRQIGTECVLVPIGRTKEDVRNIFTLNETAGLIYKSLEEGLSFQDILQKLEENYEFENASQAHNALTKTIQDLKENDLLL